MHDGAGVGLGQAASHLDGNVKRLFRRKRTAEKFAGNGFALVIGHHDEGTAVAGFFNAVNDADIRVV